MSQGSGSVVVLTHSPSPYQVELFNAVASKHPALEVIYLLTQDPHRKWSAPERTHRFRDLNTDAEACRACQEIVANAGLFVLNYYDDPQAMQLLAARTATGHSWAFWGERPGFHHPFLGRLKRRVKLRALHRSRAPVWGIGEFALEAYRREFGSRRSYVDLPYFSNLAPFGEVVSPMPPPLTFLFSGSLSHRKGVDLLAQAFARIARMNSRVRLKVMGAGELEPAMRRELASCESRVEFVGFKDWNELPDAYAGSHVLLVPSRHDGWGLVVPEGLASGLPVISTDRTGAAVEFIEQGKNGWIVPAGDGEALYEAMRLASNLTPEKWRAMREAARESVKEHTLEKGAARFFDACNEAMARD